MYKLQEPPLISAHGELSYWAVKQGAISSCTPRLYDVKSHPDDNSHCKCLKDSWGNVSLQRKGGKYEELIQTVMRRSSLQGGWCGSVETKTDGGAGRWEQGQRSREVGAGAEEQGEACRSDEEEVK